MKAVKVENYESFRIKLLQWAASFGHSTFLEDALTHKIILGVGAAEVFKVKDELPKKEWLFGYVAYDYKNALEDLVSENPETISFDDVFFYIPEIVVNLNQDTFQLEKGDYVVEELFQDINKLALEKQIDTTCQIESRLSREEYVAAVKDLQKHIQYGDIYEVNFCQEFVAKQAKLQPQIVYNDLITASPMPFAVFFKQQNKYAFCSSPERYVRREGDRLISQPIKGTVRRGASAEEDSHLVKQLKENPKERAENVMAVDVVRNDLARIAVPGTVAVDELCEVYTFKQLHQMISTVSASLPPETTLSKILKASFPMASMTGAPKIRAMELIEQYEKSKRGLYSGTIGYITPNGDFDFNVVIRTILYDDEKSETSFTVGSAITAEANAEQEYEECLLKTAAMKKILS